MPASALSGRQLDIAALIAIWIAIHGGDPSPSEITIEDGTATLIAAALDRYLATTVGEAGREDPSRDDLKRAQLEERLKSLSIELLPERDEQRNELRGSRAVTFQPRIIDPLSPNFGKPIGGPITVYV
jgi:hypothetical protein